MRVLDLFSGIGGLSLGLERAGFETAAFCEIEEYPRAVLQKHWPDVPIYRDVRELTGEQLRSDGIVPDVIAGGYPCQPWSVAGRQKGEEDPRHLWPEMHRLIRECRPSWVICENVVGHVKLGLDAVLDDLEGEDYTCWPFIIPAVAVGALHKRDRIFVVAHTRHWGSTVLADADNAKQQTGEGSVQQERWHNFGGGGKPLADSNNEQRKGCSEEPLPWERDISEQSERGREKIGDIWSVEPDVGRVADGVSHRSHRIKGLGNAVVPQVAEVIGRAIMRYIDATV